MQEPPSNISASSPSANLSDAPRPSSSRIRLRERRWLIGFGVFVLAVFIGWKPLRHELVMAIALRADAPAEAVLSELVDGTSNHAQTLERMWRSGNLIVRRFVAEYLKSHLRTAPDLVLATQSIVIEAARDPDLDVREPVMSILADDQRGDFQMLLRQQLSDADPGVRVLALQQLQRVASSNDVPIAVQLLDDSDARVVVQAALLLRKTMGVDFGIRASHALPKFTRSDEAPLQPFNLDAIHRGVEQWHEWWALHRADFPQPTSLPRIVAGGLSTKEFALEDSNGRLIHLSDFRGKAVLLCFWKIGSAASFDDMATLKELQQQEARRLAVVGIAFDPAVGPQDDCSGEGHGGGHEHQHGHTQATDAHANCAMTKPAIKELVTRMGITHPVLLDVTGTLVFRYNVQEVPTYALIDAQGNLRRRFAGSRELSTFTAMLEAISRSDDRRD